MAAGDDVGISSVPEVDVNVSSFAGSQVYISGELAGTASDNNKVCM